jgi:hypothetical protein
MTFEEFIINNNFKRVGKSNEYIQMFYFCQYS